MFDFWTNIGFGNFRRRSLVLLQGTRQTYIISFSISYFPLTVFSSYLHDLRIPVSLLFLTFVIQCFAAFFHSYCSSFFFPVVNRPHHPKMILYPFRKRSIRTS